MKINYDNLCETIDQKVKACQIAVAEDGSPVITRADYQRIKQEIFDNACFSLKKGFRMFDNVDRVSWSKYLCGSIGTYRYHQRVMVAE